MVTAARLAPWPVFEGDEVAAVEAVLRSGRVNYWTGNVCREFEAAWSSAHGGLHSLSMANGSLTLDAAMQALEIGPGDEVIVSPRSYVASAMCVVLAGATPVFADVDAESGCITVLTAEAVRSPRTRAIIPVHVAGWPCDMATLAKWAASNGVHVIEDCAQAHGGHIEGRPLGTFGTFASWSFCQDKIISTGGEGGMLCTPDPDLYRNCWSYGQHGKDLHRVEESRASAMPGEFRWLVTGRGTNLRMTEMQAAIGLRQMAKLRSWTIARRRNSEIMQEALRDLPDMHVPATPEGHAHYRCVAFTAGDDAPARRDELLRLMHARGISAGQGTCGEIYREEAFRRRGLDPLSMRRGPFDSEGRLPTARLLAETSLSFPVHHTIDAVAMRKYAEAVRECILNGLAGRAGTGRSQTHRT